MVRVTIFLNKKNECAGFKAQGHAGQDGSGRDVVCAAASMLIINTANAIERFTEDEFSTVSDDTDGSIEFMFKERPTREAQLLLKTMIQGLTSMEDDENYGQYMDIIFEEV